MTKLSILLFIIIVLLIGQHIHLIRKMKEQERKSPIYIRLASIRREQRIARRKN